jgi:hypothetical protein
LPAENTSTTVPTTSCVSWLNTSKPIKSKT